MSLDFLVIGPHPDDAEIGAGGTLALLAQRGLVFNQQNSHALQPS